MELSPELLSKLLLYSFLFGLVLGVINDVFRISRVFLGVKYSKKDFNKIYSLFRYQKKQKEITKKCKEFIVSLICFIEDLIFLLISAFGIVILCYYFDDGNIRIFVIISALIGAILWYISLGRLIIAFSEPIVIVIKFTVAFLLKIASAPILFFVSLIVRIFKIIYCKSQKGIANIINVVYNVQLREYYTKRANCGFLSCKSFERKKNVK